MTNLSKLPLSQFDMRYRLLLEKGCKEVVDVPCHDRTEAQHLRNVLTTYRSKLRKTFPDDPHQWEHLYGTIVSVKKGQPQTLQLRPRGTEFQNLFERVGIFPQPETLGDDFLPNLIEDLKTEEEK